MSSPIPTQEIEHYLRTGSTDPCYQAWPGRNLIEKGERAAAVLRAALVEEVLQRASGRRTTRLRDAIESRNGWKRILAACAPVKR